MSFVLDSSVTLAWLFEDETTPVIEDVFGRIASEGCFVSPMWYFEIANALSMAQRYGRIETGLREKYFNRLKGIGIKSDDESHDCVWAETTRLADAFKLTTYDASYLELAQRKLLPLATLDKQLRHAATSLKIPLLGL
ncbi:MAG: PIN domain-containing protein [Alphaproteobacteria bacterium]|nr:PIN domain-containing protein [Alphaproteobacteria bacterium]